MASDVESFVFGDELVAELPSALKFLSKKQFTGLLSVETWRTLSVSEQEMLMELLPSELNMAQKRDAVEKVLSGEIIHFDNPVERLQQSFSSETYAPKNFRREQKASKDARRAFAKTVAEYHTAFIKSLHLLKEEFDPLPVDTADVILEKAKRKRAPSSEGEESAEDDGSDEALRRKLAEHLRRVFDRCRALGIDRHMTKRHMASSRKRLLSGRVVTAATARRPKRGTSSRVPATAAAADVSASASGRADRTEAPPPSSPTAATAAVQAPRKRPELFELEVAPGGQLFRGVRDALRRRPATLTEITEYVRDSGLWVRADGLPWPTTVSVAKVVIASVLFLAGSPPGVEQAPPPQAVREKLAELELQEGLTLLPVPSDTPAEDEAVPWLETVFSLPANAPEAKSWGLWWGGGAVVTSEERTGDDCTDLVWSWLPTDEELPDEALEALEIHFMLSYNDDVVSRYVDDTGSTGRETDTLLARSTPIEKAIVVAQESERYAFPGRPYVYETRGDRAAVGPLKKRAAARKSSGLAARDHPLLVSSRPPYITLLSVVRDAAARLPCGVGTRQDIVVLLHDSQYTRNMHNNDAQVTQVVSGALDRLHYEEDPSVKYDSLAKHWLYLHRPRTQEEFCAIANAEASRPRKRPRVSKKPASKGKRSSKSGKSPKSARSPTSAARGLSISPAPSPGTAPSPLTVRPGGSSTTPSLTPHASRSNANRLSASPPPAAFSSLLQPATAAVSTATPCDAAGDAPVTAVLDGGGPVTTGAFSAFSQPLVRPTAVLSSRSPPAPEHVRIHDLEAGRAGTLGIKPGRLFGLEDLTGGVGYMGDAAVPGEREAGLLSTLAGMGGGGVRAGISAEADDKPKDMLVEGGLSSVWTEPRQSGWGE